MASSRLLYSRRGTRTRERIKYYCNSVAVYYNDSSLLFVHNISYPYMKIQNFRVVTQLANLNQDTKTSTFEALRVGRIHDRGLEITEEMLLGYAQSFALKTYNGADLPVNKNHEKVDCCCCC